MPIINSVPDAEDPAPKTKTGRRRALRVNDEIEIYYKDEDIWRASIVLDTPTVDTILVSIADIAETQTLQIGYFRFRFCKTEESSSSRLSSSLCENDSASASAAASTPTPDPVQPELKVSDPVMAEEAPPVTTTKTSSPKRLRATTPPEAKSSTTLAHYKLAAATLPPYLGKYTESKEAAQQADSYNWNSLYPR